MIAQGLLQSEENTEEQMKDAPKWQRDLYDFTQGLDKAIEPGVPLLLIVAGGAAGAKGSTKPPAGVVKPPMVEAPKPPVVAAPKPGGATVNDVVFGHGARHLEGLSVSQTAVESAIRADVFKTASSFEFKRR